MMYRNHPISQGVCAFLTSTMAKSNKKKQRILVRTEHIPIRKWLVMYVGSY